MSMKNGFMIRGLNSYYLTEGERGPVPRTKHKDHLEKVVFLSVIAHPRYECVCLMER
jgi:hypothetical protein